MKFEVTILGCGSAAPTLLRSASSQYINVRERHLLIDCGEGTQIQLRKYKAKFQKINHLFISHLHGDHFFGLVGLLSSLHLLGRTNPIHIYGPPELKEVLSVTFKASQTYLNFEYIFHDLSFDSKHLIMEDKLIEVYSFPLIHRVDCCGFIVQEKLKERGMRKDKILEYKISLEAIPSIKKGGDLMLESGEVIPNDEVTNGPPASRSYAYCSDTAFSEDVIEAVKDVDVLYHEATFTSNLTERAKETMHSTTVQAAEVAKRANAGKLVIGHFSGRYTEDLSVYDEEIAPIFPNYQLAEDGMVINVSQE
ncbi:MAG: ribonuclease Z [Flavobacteriales bacterium]|nr:ribonuclease Z [Flavobacteriales bacterium]